MVPFFLLLFGGPLLWGAAEYIQMRRRNLRADSALLRRRAAKNRKKELLNALTLAGNKKEWDSALREIAVPVLSDLQDLPPGISAGELAGHIHEVDLASALRECESSSFRPVSGELDPHRKNAVIRALKKLLIFGLLFQTIALSAADLSAEAAAAYDRSDFPAAQQSYQKLLDSAAAPDAATLYNYGCSAFMNGDLPLARAAFEEVNVFWI